LVVVLQLQPEKIPDICPARKALSKFRETGWGEAGDHCIGAVLLRTVEGWRGDGGSFSLASSGSSSGVSDATNSTLMLAAFAASLSLERPNGAQATATRAHSRMQPFSL
jgi:hypothetical protein